MSNLGFKLWWAGYNHPTSDWFSAIYPPYKSILIKKDCIYKSLKEINDIFQSGFA
jgi:hypothetical protein